MVVKCKMPLGVILLGVCLGLPEGGAGEARRQLQLGAGGGARSRNWICFYPHPVQSCAPGRVSGMATASGRECLPPSEASRPSPFTWWDGEL